MQGTAQVLELRRSHTELLFNRFLALWQNPRTSSRVPLFVFLTGLAVICGAAVFTGAVPTRIFGHDVFIPLDIGWRVLNGQRPHVDFTSAWGPVWFLIVALGLTLSGNSVNGIGYANAFVALVVAIWCFRLGRHRVLNASLILLSLFLAALVAAPYPLSINPWVPSHAMVYNRYGYALLGLILLECCEPIRGPKHNRFRDAVGGFSTGVALSLTLFLKASYFLVALVLIAIISVVLRRLQRARLLGVFLGFCCASICLLAYLRFHLLAMLRDLHMAAGARGEGFTLTTVADNAFSFGSVLLAVALFAFTTTLVLGGRVAQWRGLRLPITAALCLLADIGLMSSNAQRGSFPVCAVLAILIVNDVVQDLHGLQTTESSWYAGALCLAALLFVPQFSSDIAGLAYGVWEKARPPAPSEVLRFTTANLRPLLLYEGNEERSNGKAFTTYVNDGVALLEAHTRPDETILTMDMTNPFPYATQRRPAHGGFVAPAARLTITAAHRPSDDEFLGDTDILMIPKHPSTDNEFIQWYQGVITRRYYVAAQSDWWWFCKRRLPANTPNGALRSH